MCKATGQMYLRGQGQAGKSELVLNPNGFSDNSILHHNDGGDPASMNEGSQDDEHCQQSPGYSAVVSQEDFEEEDQCCIEQGNKDHEGQVIAERHV